MNKGFFDVSKKSVFAFVCTVLAFILIGVFVMVGYVGNRNTLKIDETVIPEGWYVYVLNESLLILTQSPALPEIGDTELMAYGEQILVSATPLSNEGTEPEEWESLSWTDDTAMVHEKNWLMLGELKALRLEHEAGGASGGSLTYYIFKGRTAYTLSLYPFDESQHVEIFETFVSAYAQSLE